MVERAESLKRRGLSWSKRIFLIFIGFAFVPSVALLFLVSDRPTIANEDLSPYSMEIVYQLLKRHHPDRLPKGKAHRISLNQEQINALSSMVSSVLDRVNLTVHLIEEDFLLRSSIRIIDQPNSPKYINLDLEGRLSINAHQPELMLDSVTLNEYSFSTGELRRITDFLLERLWEHPVLPAKFRNIEEFRIRNSQLQAIYIPPLVQGEEKGGNRIDFLYESEIISKINETFLAILLNLRNSIEGSDVFAIMMESAFRYTNSLKFQGYSSIESNKIALNAISLCMGNPVLSRRLGNNPLLTDSFNWIEKNRKRFRIYDRHDFAQHFIASAMLTIHLGEEKANRIGLNKEIRDFEGSGFSFDDLLADRSGVAFAKLLLDDETRADDFGYQIANKFYIDHFFPSPSGLPESLTEEDFERKFGHINSADYQKLIRKIDQKIASGPAYRNMR